MPTFDSKLLLENLLVRATARIKQRFGEIILKLKEENSLEALAKLIEGGRIDEALAVLNSAADRLASTVQLVWIGAGSDVAEAMSTALGIHVSFDAANTYAVAAMARSRLDLVREFTSQQRAATQQALLDGVARGLNPREVARSFRDSIGLTQRQEQAVANYRKLLEQNSGDALTRRLRDARFDSTVRGALEGGEPLEAKQIERMVERYRDRMLKYRSEVIARTEGLRAVNEGSEETFRQALANSVIQAEDVQRTWNTAKDERVRSTHSTMHRQARPVGVPFTSGAGVELRYPGDSMAPPAEVIQCRCVVATRVSV